MGDIRCGEVLARRLLSFGIAAAVAMLGAVGMAQSASAKTKVTAEIVGDVLTVTGTKNRDLIALRLADNDPGPLQVALGRSERVVASFDRAALSSVYVHLGDGDDSLRVDESHGTFTDIQSLTVDAGPGRDLLNGGSGGETFIGGPGADSVRGGAGDDALEWHPGDGSDALDGQAGFDSVVIRGSDSEDSVEVSADASWALLDFNADRTRSIDVERFAINTSSGADSIVVDDLTATSVTDVQIAVALAGGDGVDDGVLVMGTAADDVIVALGDANGVAIIGLASLVNIVGAQSNDILNIDALSGNDTVEASGLTVGTPSFTAYGRDGDDVLIGGDGDDFLLGGEGDDVLIGGPGIDILDGGPGDNVVIQ